jgi:hypothetical protein
LLRISEQAKQWLKYSKASLKEVQRFTEFLEHHTDPDSVGDPRCGSQTNVVLLTDPPIYC